MIDYSGTMNVLGFNEVVYMCHPPDQTDAQDHRGSLDRHSHHVAALTYSMNTLLQMRMISVSHPIVYIPGCPFTEHYHTESLVSNSPTRGYPPHLFLQGVDATLCPGESMCGGSRQTFHPMKNRGGARGQAAGMPAGCPK